MKFINKTNEEIINIVKSKEAFGGFFIDLKYRNHTLCQRLKNISNKTKQLIPVYLPSGVTYYYNPFYQECINLDTLSYKKLCNRYTKKYPNCKDWNLQTLQQTISSVTESKP